MSRPPTKQRTPTKTKRRAFAVSPEEDRLIVRAAKKLRIPPGIALRNVAVDWANGVLAGDER